jgi:hypothetical protein
MYVDVLNYGCGSISHTFGILVSGCIHAHVNGKLEYIRLIFMCMLICQMMVEGMLILRQSTANTHVHPASELHNISTTFTWKNLNDHTRHPFIEL